ncbi:hypothetical protein L916_20441 [Phytophthora nicotianae]|uniref:DUF659 domain-containing protein n=1 Tax=Phytophthora nicotianae TaxID=4792 RepID=W2HUU8_PHYNI|nr:hypothetical protein L916_20441 [Phytophthora nicotianae]
MIDAETKGWKTGAAITDDASQCSRGRRILALRWPDVVFLKCFAHDINNLVKSILSSPTFRSVTTQAQKAVKALNASSAKWLKRAQDMDAEEGTSPLYFASLKLQNEENTLADVVIVLRDLHEKFRRSVYSDELTKLVEARWAMCEQPLFMLALYLHPAYYKDAAKLSTSMVTDLENITDSADYRKFVRDATPVR